MSLDSLDFFPGDPVNHVLGRSDEKPARRHGRPKPKPGASPPLSFEERLLRDVRLRKAMLESAVKEVPQLEDALKRLKEIK